ncbi:hypothetical protein [Paenibacillus medicaginis]|uniref:Phage protein n=1 Tax=Paenibacillus medicaginis TaxID=1470560 RepID=A0ABV5BY18_9BACL
MEFNVQLYDLLKESETGLYKKGDDIIGYVHLCFSEIEEFTKAVGNDWFSEGGVEARLFNDTLCVELNELFEYYGYKFSDYKNCFDEIDWSYYEEEILATEED